VCISLTLSACARVCMCVCLSYVQIHEDVCVYTIQIADICTSDTTGKYGSKFLKHRRHVHRQTANSVLTFSLRVLLEGRAVEAEFALELEVEVTGECIGITASPTSEEADDATDDAVLTVVTVALMFSVFDCVCVCVCMCVIIKLIINQYLKEQTK